MAIIMPFSMQMAAGAERFASSNLGASGTAPRHGAQAEKKVEDHFSLLLQREVKIHVCNGNSFLIHVRKKMTFHTFCLHSFLHISGFSIAQISVNNEVYKGPFCFIIHLPSIVDCFL